MATASVKKYIAIIIYSLIVEFLYFYLMGDFTNIA